jgi:hypothetical protein
MVRSLTTLLVALASGAALAESQLDIGEQPLLSVPAVDSQGITFQVPTGGCTAKENFGLETVAPKPLTVRLVRLRPDYCEAHLPDGVKIKFTFAEIGAGPQLDAKAQKTLVILNAAK